MDFEAESIINYDDKSCLEWEIKPFQDFMKNGLQQIESPMFLSSEKCRCDWQLYLFRKIENNIENLQLNLKFLSSSKVAEIEILQISCVVCTRSGTKYQERILNNIKLKSDEDVLVFLMPAKEIMYNSFIISCTIQYSAKVISSMSQTFNDVKNIPTNILSDFKSLLKYKAFSDVKLISQGKEFQVHKMILSARSPVFSAMFQHDMKEQQTNEVIIDDVAPEVLEEMINFIYSDEIANISSGLLMLADKYDIKGLKVKCEHALEKTLTSQNVIEMLNLSRHCNAEYLKNHAMNFIKKFGKDIVKTSEFKNLEDSQAKIILELFLSD